jgi:hypothetical protein
MDEYENMGREGWMSKKRPYPWIIRVLFTLLHESMSEITGTSYEEVFINQYISLVSSFGPNCIFSQPLMTQVTPILK